MLGGEERHEHVVHVAAVVDHEDDGGIGRNVAERAGVDVPDADAEEGRRETSRQPVRQPMVKPRAEVRDDFVGVGVHRGKNRVERSARGDSLGRRGGANVGVGDQFSDDSRSLFRTEGSQPWCGRASRSGHERERRACKAATPSLYLYFLSMRNVRGPGASTTLKSDGTANRSGAGSARVMFVSR